jgi:hypothetical protein
MDLKDTGYGDVNRVHMAQERNQGSCEDGHNLRVP